MALIWDAAPADLTATGEWRTDEERRVFTWRLSCFLDLGLGAIDAEILASSRVAWHELEQLIRGGCPPMTAEKILL